ncbi:flagellar protein FliT [Nitrosospira sp. Nsp18]|jgi:flagellar protein FliT|uniref:flagellar protein FliT n=1 Tax=Nitrosospira sp. Nsp18 TaxID=1855334 RepID=UPI0008806A25|nr:flagellar protein FliT [Nitrosospira sp. Nsp18]SDA12068.1 flagellar protein FliT [Nitrosospira sp. Nsp18]
MMNSTEKIAAYQSISNLTGEMVEAARASEWDKLEILEHRCAALVTQLRAAPPVRLTVDMQQQKVELIHKILADDAEIRTHTEPWMKSVQTLLGNAGMARRVHQAYDTHT